MPASSPWLARCNRHHRIEQRRMVRRLLALALVAIAIWFALTTGRS
jgi:hypothetical protein